MKWRIQSQALEGAVEVPGDKSIGHRALMMAGIAAGESHISHLPNGEDVFSTARCLRDLGVSIEIANEEARVNSGPALVSPDETLDAGNSGTTMRLLSGILAAQPFATMVNGDESLQRRPMGRVIEPLSQMGASIESRDGRAPLTIAGRPLHGIRYTLPVASAQVKSAILLAGLFAEGTTEVREPTPTRDHTERMLRALGVAVEQQAGTVAVRGGSRPRAFQLRIPGDASSAAFFLAAAALGGGEVEVRNVGANPTRTGFLRVLQQMGTEIDVEDERLEAGEPIATVRARKRALNPITIGASEVPALVDELPLVALMATQARGTSTIRGAAELRLKETDRISAVTASLRALGAEIEELPDGFVVRGPAPLRGAAISSHGDHRLAMMLAVAGTIATGETIVGDADAAAVSYPGFGRDFRSVGGRLDDA